MYQSNAAPWVWFRAYNTDGTPKTDLVYNETDIDIDAVRDSGLTALTPSEASSATDWAAGKLWQIAGNLYKIGISTATISSYTGLLSVEGSFDGGTINGIAVEVSAYNPANDPAVAGDEMDLVDAPNATAVTAIQSGLATQTSVDTIDGIVDAILLDTDELQSNQGDWATADVASALGTGTWATAIPWNAAWDAEVQSEVDDGLRALSLDSALIAQGAERAVNVDVNHRVHSHVYDMQANTITASALAADAVAEIQSGLATSACDDRLGYVLAALAGACADAGTAAETYTITIGADTFTIDHTGLDATGNRGTAVLTKS